MMKEGSQKQNIPFDLGCLLSELLIQVDQAIISHQRDGSGIYRKKQNIRIFFVFDELQELRRGLNQINISEETQTDIESYIERTTMKYGLTQPDEELEINDKKLISKVRSKIRKKRHTEMEFKLDDLEDLSTTLKLWKDRISIDLGRMEISD